MPFVCCPFCGEAGDLRILGASPAAFVVCGTCHTRGPFGESREQAIANWNRRPTSTLVVGALIPEQATLIHFDDGSPPDDGTIAAHLSIPLRLPGLDGLLARETPAPPLSPFLAMVVEVTDLVCPPPHVGEDGRDCPDGCEGCVARGYQAAGAPMTGEALGVFARQLKADPDYPQLSSGDVDELAAARERRDLQGLPSISIEATDSGLSMDFDLGGPPPKGKR